MNSIASNSPIVREIIFQIISAGEIENVGDKHRIDNDVVPAVSQKTHMLSSGFKESALKISPQILTEKLVLSKVPIKRPMFVNSPVPNIIPEKYGRLNNLIQDNSISSIEYIGEGMPIRVTRFGKTQNTNIILAKEEVAAILNYISGRTNIPITNKLFKVALDNLLFNAIVSEEIGTRFLVKKNFQISPDYREALK